MDNDHPGHLVAWLKDLAQGLPRAEREHWRSKNILPDGVPSKTFYIRNVRALPANPVMPDLRLKMMYPVVNEAWAAKYGWQLWREPQPEDRYVFRQLHVCLDENQSEFDQQNGLLAKVIVDFVNKERLTAALMEPTPSEGGLNVLQAFLEQDGHTDAKEQVEPLRVIQQLRSAGAAHGKGANYAAAMRRGELVGLSLVGASMKVFQGAVAFITWIGAMVLKMPAPEPWPID